MNKQLKKEARKLNQEGSARHNYAALTLAGVNELTDFWIDEATLAQKKRDAEKAGKTSRLGMPAEISDYELGRHDESLAIVAAIEEDV